MQSLFIIRPAAVELFISIPNSAFGICYSSKQYAYFKQLGIVTHELQFVLSSILEFPDEFEVPECYLSIES